MSCEHDVSILSYRLVTKSYNVATQWCKKFQDMFSHFDRIPACDRQMDRQTSCNSLVCAMHTIAR